MPRRSRGAQRACARQSNVMGPGTVRVFEGKEFQFAYIQSVGSQGAYGPPVQDGVTGFAGLAAAARSLHARVHPDAQEAELGPAQGSTRTVDQRDRKSTRLNSSHLG